MGRLFWKLFACFWAGMMLSFVAGVGYLHLSGQPDRGETIAGLLAGVRMADAEAVLRRSGPGPVIAMLANPDGAAPGLTLTGPDGAVLVGPDPPRGAVRRAVAAFDGTVYHLSSAVVPLYGDGARSPTPAVPVVSGAVVAFGLSLFLAWYLSRPLQQVRRAFHAVAAGRLETRIAPLMGRRRDEIADLGHDFDGMADQLQRFVESRQRLLHDISHELRSPLARLRVAIGLMRQSPADGAAMLDRLDREAERMDAMVEDLLTLARLEVGVPIAGRERIDLIELLGAIVEDADFEARAAGRAVRLEADGHFVCRVNGEMVYRAFENIIRNAVRFTAPATTVVVRAGVSSGGGFWAVVADRGPGVPAAMLDRIFEPFLRLETDQPGDGFGLGLAIARRAVESQGGRLHAEPGEDGGLRMCLSLPGGPPGAGGGI